MDDPASGEAFEDGVAGVDLAGAGGTSWIAVEAERATGRCGARQLVSRMGSNRRRPWPARGVAGDILEGFASGIPDHLQKDRWCTLAASGGIRSLGCGARPGNGRRRGGIPQPSELTARRPVGAQAYLENVIDGLETAMLMAGVHVEDLRNVPRVTALP